MVKESKLSSSVHITKGNSKMEEKKELENMSVPQDQFTRDSSKTNSLMVKDSLSGKTTGRIAEVGRTERCMGMGSSPGQTVIDMKESITIVKNKAREPFTGIMGRFSSENGLMAKSMGKGDW